MSITKYSIIAVLIMVGLSLLGIVLPEGVLPLGSKPFVVAAIALAGVTGMIGYAIAYKGITTQVKLFTAYVMGSMFLKMMVGLMGITIVALQFKDFAKPFVLVYFFCYFIFTSFEVVTLLRKLRAENGSNTRRSQENDDSQK